MTIISEFEFIMLSKCLCVCVCVKFSFLKVIFAHACHFQSIPGSLSAWKIALYYKLQNDSDFEVAICFCVLFFLVSSPVQYEFIQEFDPKCLMLE